MKSILMWLLNPRRCECGERRRCPVRVCITGSGVASTKSEQLMKCGKVKKQIEMVKEI